MHALSSSLLLDCTCFTAILLISVEDIHSGGISLALCNWLRIPSTIWLLVTDLQCFTSFTLYQANHWYSVYCRVRYSNRSPFPHATTWYSNRQGQVSCTAWGRCGRDWDWAGCCLESAWSPICGKLIRSQLQGPPPNYLQCPSAAIGIALCSMQKPGISSAWRSSVCTTIIHGMNNLSANDHNLHLVDYARMLIRCGRFKLAWEIIWDALRHLKVQHALDCLLRRHKASTKALMVQNGLESGFQTLWGSVMKDTQLAARQPGCTQLQWSQL